MQEKNSPERHAHPDSDDDENIHLNADDAIEIIDVDPNGDENVENQIEDLELDTPMEEEQEQEEDDSILTVNRHGQEKSVFSLTIDPSNCRRVCSGGEDDKCAIWRIDNGELITEHLKFDDSVHQVCWSFDGKYICACDMRGQIRCWTDDQNGVPNNEIWSFHTGTDIEIMRFHPSANVLLVGTNDSQLWMFKIPSGEYKIMHGGSDSELINIEVFNNGKQCLCGYGNGQVKLWDLKQNSIVWQYDPQKDGEQQLNSNPKCISLCLNDEQTLIGCGGADGYCRVLNANNGKILASLACFTSSTATSESRRNGHEHSGAAALDEDEDDDDDESTLTSIESVAFGVNHLLICGTLSGYIYLWNVSNKQLRTTLNLQSGVVKTVLNDGYLLYAACLDGHIRLLDIRNGEPLKEWKSGGGQGCEIMDMIITKDKRHLLCAYMQGSCRVFQLKE